MNDVRYNYAQHDMARGETERFIEYLPEILSDLRAFMATPVFIAAALENQKLHTELHQALFRVMDVSGYLEEIRHIAVRLAPLVEVLDRWECGDDDTDSALETIVVGLAGKR